MIELERPTVTNRPALGAGLPIVAIAGRWGKTTVARLLEALVRGVHPRLLLWTDQGVYRRGRRQPGELIPWEEGLRALAQGELDLAIQELDAPTVLAVGLPPEAYSLAIITSFCGNDEACLVDPSATAERQAHLAVARAVHPSGALVLNADDHAVAAEHEVTAGEVIYYGLHRRNPFIKAHLAAGGRAVCVSSGMVVLCKGRRSRPVLPVHDLELALGGAIVFQVENVLAAVAAAWRLGVDAPAMATALRAFTSSPTLMPGACNQVRVGGATLIVDRLTDPFSARALLRGLRKVSGRRRRLVVLPAFPRLAAGAATEIGRLIGRTFDLVILHQADYRDGALDALDPLRAGIALNRVPPVVLTYPDEGHALGRLLRVARAGDLILVLADDLSLALRSILTYRPTPENSLSPAGVPV